MYLVIGTDEAGYGPNLGPLAITATAWLVEDTLLATRNFTPPPDLYQLFEPFFARPGEHAGDRIRVGDSKSMYKTGQGLAGLESLVIPLAFDSLEAVNRTDDPPTWSGLLSRLGVEPGLENCPRSNVANEKNRGSSLRNVSLWFQGLPWYQGFDPELPIDLEPSDHWLKIPRATANHSGACRSLARLIEPSQFNDGMVRLGNKATLLSHTTLSLVHELLMKVLVDFSDVTFERVIVQCDKHGGRTFYGGVLQDIFSDSWVQVVQELPACSQYRLEWGEIPVQIEFLAKGESHLPIAVASMISKYLRELAMLAFNRFWLRKKPGLRPTAGYPVDARRFRHEIEMLACNLGIEESVWWRNR